MKLTRNFDLEVFFTKYEFSVQYNIGGSDLQSVTISDLLELCNEEERNKWENLYLGYTETYGAPRLREVIAETYDTVKLFCRSRRRYLCNHACDAGT